MSDREYNELKAGSIIRDNGHGVGIRFKVKKMFRKSVDCILAQTLFPSDKNPLIFTKDYLLNNDVEVLNY